MFNTTGAHVRRTRPIAMTAVWALTLLFLMVFLSSAVPRPSLGASSIKSDERVIFFPAFAHRINRNQWRAKIHGWIFEPETGSRKRRVLLAGLRGYLGVPRGRAKQIFKRRGAYFLADNERNKRISIRLGSEVHQMEPSNSNGHFYGEININAGAAEKLRAGANHRGWVDFRAVTRRGDKRVFRGRLRFVPTNELGVISDIDDTIKISNVLKRRELIANAFYRPLKPVIFVAGVYATWARRGATFYYVSGSPWQLFPSIHEFMKKKGFPGGEFRMKYLRVKDRSFFRFIGGKQTRFKLQAIREIFATHPGRRFFLVGDSGESDPEVYARIAREYPGRVRAIIIRDVRGNRHAERFKSLFASLQKKGVIIYFFKDGRDLNYFPP